MKMLIIVQVVECQRTKGMLTVRFVEQRRIEAADVCVKCGAKLKKLNGEPKSKIVAGLLESVLRSIWDHTSLLLRLYNNWSRSINIKCSTWIFYMWCDNCDCWSMGIY